MPDAGAARRAAERILAGPQFHARPAKSFDPLGGVLHAIGRVTAAVLGPPARAVGRVYDALARAIGPGPALALILVVLVGGFAWIVLVLARRRARLGPAPVHAGAGPPGATPDELDRLADRAEAAGDAETAVRLRFRAGLARLELGGLVIGRETMTSHDLAGALGSASFDQLAADLEAILYAGRTARPEQAAAARELWPRVLDEAGHRS